jgi:hypothetical protein
VARKTIYVRDEDLPLWNRAFELGGGNLSRMLTDVVRDFVNRRDQELIATRIQEHGGVRKRHLLVWTARGDPDRTEWGTTFETTGTGPEGAAGLIRISQSDESAVRITLEEERLYEDGWVDREKLNEWIRNDGRWRATRYYEL